MTYEENEMSLVTVRGSVDPSAIGIVSPHEHIFVDIRNQYTEPENRKKDLSMEE